MENNLDFEYYIISRVNNDKHPLLVVKKGGGYQNSDELIEDPQPMEYRLGQPVPKKPVMVDYHSSPYSVISSKVAMILKNLDVKGIQLIPATITGKDEDIYEGYFYLHIYNLLSAMDKNESIYEWDDFLNICDSIDKLVLDEKYLATLPLDERLIFKLKEDPMCQIYHQSVVDAIMATNPEGIKFTNVKDWTIGTPFD